MKIIALFLLTVSCAWAGPYAVHVKVAHKGATLEKCSVDLVVDGAAAGHAVTGDDGRVDFEGLVSERFELLVKRDRYWPRRIIVYNFARRDVSEDVELKARVRWTLSGSVRSRTGMLAGAKVKLATGADQPEDVVTAANGRFELTNLYDDECQFTVEAAGYHRHLVWMANREQRDISTDVEMRALKEKPAEPWLVGEPDEPVELRFFRAVPRRFRPDPAYWALLATRRIEPEEEGPDTALTQVRLTLSTGARPRGELARVDQLLAARVRPFRKKKKK